MAKQKDPRMKALNIKEPPDLSIKAKPTKGRVRVLLVLPYEGVNVYVRQVDGTLFEYMLPYKGEIYSSYFEIYPDKEHIKKCSKCGYVQVGDKSFTQKQFNNIEQLVLAGAHSTIEYLKGIENAEIEHQKALGEFVIEHAKPIKKEVVN